MNLSPGHVSLEPWGKKEDNEEERKKKQYRVQHSNDGSSILYLHAIGYFLGSMVAQTKVEGWLQGFYPEALTTECDLRERRTSWASHPKLEPGNWLLSSYACRMMTDILGDQYVLHHGCPWTWWLMLFTLSLVSLIHGLLTSPRSTTKSQSILWKAPGIQLRRCILVRTPLLWEVME